MNWKLIRHIDQYLGIPLLWLLKKSRLVGTGALPAQADVKKILIIKFWGIGNLFLLLPSISFIKATYPNARIDFLTLSSNRSIVELLYEDSVITSIDTSNTLSFVRNLYNVFSSLRTVGYDIVIDFEQFARISAILAAIIGGRARIGFRTKGQHRDSLYTIQVPYDNTLHTALSFQSLAMSAGASSEPLPELTPPGFKEEYAYLGHKLLAKWGVPDSTSLIVLHIGTSKNFHERRWPSSHFASLADMLTTRHHIRIVFTGLEEEVEKEWQPMTPAAYQFNMVGKLAFPEFFSLIAAADLVLSADTSAVHIASALDIPVIGLYGPNTPTLYGPWGKNGMAINKEFPCSPCITNFNSKLNVCRHPDGKGACMDAITAAEVYDCIIRNYPDLLSPLIKGND